MTKEDLDRRQIDRCLAALEEALARCRTEDVRFGLGIAVPLSFLEHHADEKWPFDQFRNGLEDFSTDGLKAEARWQALNVALNGIKRAVKPQSTAH